MWLTKKSLGNEALFLYFFAHYSIVIPNFIAWFRKAMSSLCVVASEARQSKEEAPGRSTSYLWRCRHVWLNYVESSICFVVPPRNDAKRQKNPALRSPASHVPKSRSPEVN